MLHCLGNTSKKCLKKLTKELAWALKGLGHTDTNTHIHTLSWLPKFASYAYEAMNSFSHSLTV